MAAKRKLIPKRRRYDEGGTVEDLPGITSGASPKPWGLNRDQLPQKAPYESGFGKTIQRVRPADLNTDQAMDKSPSQTRDSGVTGKGPPLEMPRIVIARTVQETAKGGLVHGGYTGGYSKSGQIMKKPKGYQHGGPVRDTAPGAASASSRPWSANLAGRNVTMRNKGGKIGNLKKGKR